MNDPWSRVADVIGVSQSEVERWIALAEGDLLGRLQSILDQIQDGDD